jgi:tRNA(fMet)-specific endonuclease VapC
MTLWILDTDHISLWQRNNPQIVNKIATIGIVNISTTIITVEEQFRGRLDMIRRADSALLRISAYERMRETLLFFRQIPQVFAWSPEAEINHLELKRQRVNIGSQDLRIASIVLAAGGTLVTRNRRDFNKVPGLQIDDWS